MAVDIDVFPGVFVVINIRDTPVSRDIFMIPTIIPGRPILIAFWFFVDQFFSAFIQFAVRRKRKNNLRQKVDRNPVEFLYPPVRIFG